MYSLTLAINYEARERFDPMLKNPLKEVITILTSSVDASFSKLSRNSMIY